MTLSGYASPLIYHHLVTRIDTSSSHFEEYDIASCRDETEADILKTVPHDMPFEDIEPLSLHR